MKNKKILMKAGIVLCILFVGITLLAFKTNKTSKISKDIATTTAQRGIMEIIFSETGEINASERSVISNNLEHSAIIQSIAEAGKLVEKGEEILVFKCTELKNSIDSQKLNLASAENEYNNAIQTLAQQELENESKLRTLENGLENAKSDLQQFVKHDKPRKINEAHQDFLLKEREYKQAEDKLNFKRSVNSDIELSGTYSEAEIYAQELEVDKLKLELEKTRSNEEKILNFEIPKNKRQYKLGVINAEHELQKNKLESESKISSAKTGVDTTKKLLEMKKEYLDLLNSEAEKLVVKAERTGYIIYDSGEYWNHKKPSVGEQVTPHQQLMIIPDLDSLIIDSKVYENQLDQVYVGLETRIHLDSWPKKIFHGKIKKVSSVPDSSSWLGSIQKSFNIEIECDELPESLKPGMSARIELSLATLRDVLMIPIAAVFCEGEENICYVVNGKDVIKKTIQTGKINATHVEIVEGLNDDDIILLSHPEKA